MLGDILLHVDKLQLMNIFLFFYQGKEEEELQVLTKLKETIDKQRNQIRGIKKELNQKQADSDAVSSHLFSKLLNRHPHPTSPLPNNCCM